MFYNNNSTIFFSLHRIFLCNYFFLHTLYLHLIIQTHTRSRLFVFEMYTHWSELQLARSNSFGWNSISLIPQEWALSSVRSFPAGRSHNWKTNRSSVNIADRIIQEQEIGKCLSSQMIFFHTKGVLSFFICNYSILTDLG